MQVIHELDDKSHDPRLKDRAKRVIQELRTIRKNGNIIRPNVTLELLSQDPPDQLFRPGLNPRNNDDRILQCVLSRKEVFPLEEIGVISEDFGMEIKCDNLNISVLRPDPAKKLPDLIDAHLRQLRDAQHELEKHKNTLPNLALSFKAEGDALGSHFKFRLPSSSPLDIETAMKALRSRYPLMEPKADAEIRGNLPKIQFLGTVSKQEYDRYNEELDDFFSRYEDYLKVCELLRQTNERSFKVAFTLENDGHSPAHQIDIHIHFPDGMDILDAHNLPPGFKDRKPPDPPKEPRRDIDKLFNIRDFQSSFINQNLPHIRIPDLPKEEPNVSSPSITKTSSYDIHFAVRKLKHGYTLNLGTLMILFPSKNEAKSFSVDYQITADNHPQSQDGRLHFVLLP